MNYTISGIIWYQGESDSYPQSLAPVYVDKLNVVINDYRDRINQNYHDFPIFSLEYPSTYGQPAGYSGQQWMFMDLGEIRTYTGTETSKITNLFMAASSDLWNNKTHWNNIHPYIKCPQATRVVDLITPIFYSSYEQSDIDEKAGPAFVKGTKTAEKEAEIVFTHYGSGLKTIDGNAPKGFEVKVNGAWVAASNVTIKDAYTLKVSHGEDFTAVRYNGNTSYFFPTDINMCNSAGVPMIAFIAEFN
jgi:sialate O-acetylesterase